MSTSEMSLEQIAAEITQLNPKNAPRDSVGNAAPGSFRKELGGVGGAVLRARFGEVVECFLRVGKVREVCRETGLSQYTIRRYFLGNPEFAALLQSANATIFLDATKSLRDGQASMIEKSQQLAQDALDEMERLLNDSESEHIRFKVAQDLLDRDPRISRTKRIESTGVNVTIEQKTLTLAMEAAGELEARNVTPTEGAHTVAGNSPKVALVPSQPVVPSVDVTELFKETK